MHLSFSAVVAAGLICVAVEAVPRRGHGHGHGHGHGWNGTEASRGHSHVARFPTGAAQPTGTVPVFPSEFPPASFPPGFPTGIPSGFPAGNTERRTRTHHHASHVHTTPASRPTGGKGASSISFALPSSVHGNMNAVADANASASTKKPAKSSKATSATAKVSGPNGSTASASKPSRTGHASGNATSPSGGSSGSAASTTFPEAAGESTLSKPMSVTGVFDGGMKRFGRGTKCTGQAEGGDSDAVFQVQEGGTLKNVIIGADQSEGVHCMGSCTIENVWWEAVCEDALTIKQTSGTSKVIGGGAKGAQDKVIQHNGGGTVAISGFYVSDFGKLYRSCGNCKTMFERHVTLDKVVADGGTSTFVGINTNYKDTATITNSCIKNTKAICEEFEGNDTGAEPKQVGKGPSSSCIYTDADINAC